MSSPASWCVFCSVSWAQLCTVPSGMTAFAVNPATANTATRTSPYRPSRAGGFMSAPDGGVAGRADGGEHRRVLDPAVGSDRQAAGGRGAVDGGHSRKLGRLGAHRGVAVPATHSRHLVLRRCRAHDRNSFTCVRLLAYTHRGYGSTAGRW